jgi:hypothetical protein
LKEVVVKEVEVTAVLEALNCNVTSLAEEL